MDSEALSMTLSNHRAFQTPNGLSHASHSLTPGVVGLSWLPEYASNVITMTN